ncbi:MAG: outer membrane beta-barrel protein [Deltaproteobacteria bacterium]|nr:outer membrane beta-barrel protein [Deltaproteobacteria bacterium]
MSFVCIFLFFSFAPSPPVSMAQRPPALQDGIAQYKSENYEEAIEILKKVREADPKSSSAAFFLGLSYKQTLDYANAMVHLRDAVTLHPKIKEALVELIDVALLLDKQEEAKKWIKVAEEAQVFPARVAFLKGLLLKKEKKNHEAIESFKRAMQLDETLAQSAEFQIALCHMEEKELKEAQQQFQAAVLHGPQSDLAAFARRYEDLVEKRMFIERPLRFTVSTFGFYDTNVILAPNGGTASIGEITDEGAAGFATSARVDWVPKLEGPWLFNAQYNFRWNYYDKFRRTHNIINNGIYVTPGYNFGNQALNLVASYDFSFVGTELHRYNSIANVGPLYRRILHPQHVLEAFVGYNKQKYFQAVVSPEEDRNGSGMRTYLSWFYNLKKGGLFNLRWDYEDNDTDGSNWRNKSNQVSANFSYPLRSNLSVQLNGLVLWQDYDNVHTATLIPGLGPPRARDDTFYQATIALSWEFYKNLNLVGQFMVMRSDSNIVFFDYDRQIGLLGLEYRF